MKPGPEARVLKWLKGHPPSSLFTSSITQAEVLYGIRLLPPGKRRDGLEKEAGEMFCEDFRGRILSFGSEAASLYAQLASDRQRAGRPISQFEPQIAALARSSGALLATRNENDLKDAEFVSSIPGPLNDKGSVVFRPTLPCEFWVKLIRRDWPGFAWRCRQPIR